jgi:hypothetical protein
MEGKALQLHLKAKKYSNSKPYSHLLARSSDTIIIEDPIYVDISIRIMMQSSLVGLPIFCLLNPHQTI